MSKKKRYEYRERSSDDDYRERKKSHRLQPHDRWRKTDYQTLNYTDGENEQEEWGESQ